MKYYIGSSNRVGKKKKIGKALLYILAYTAAFALAFFISYKLVSATQSGYQQEAIALRAEVSELNSQLAEKEEIIGTMQMQMTALEGELAESQRKYEELANATTEEQMNPDALQTGVPVQ
ncbi:MAG: hypothetical protein IKB50_00115 [Clostridia bacterium]|nr:hypothetical protein [Clostridia bacterium]